MRMKKGARKDSETLNCQIMQSQSARNWTARKVKDEKCVFFVLCVFIDVFSMMIWSIFFVDLKQLMA